MWNDQRGFNFANATTKNDLDKSVVDDAGEYVDDVEDGEGHQQVVEGGPHLWLPGGDNTEFLLVTSQMTNGRMGWSDASQILAIVGREGQDVVE